MNIEVIRACFILNDIETESPRLLPKTLSGMFPNEGNKLVYMVRLDREMRQDTVHDNLLRRTLSIRNAEQIMMGATSLTL
jgi:hypothetical protein